MNIEEMNIDLYKKGYESYQKLLKKFLDYIPDDEMLDYLKKKKKVKFNWEKDEWEKL